jgi:hypothetical protein
MVQRQETGELQPPDHKPVFRQTWLAMIEHPGAKNLVIGGESRGQINNLVSCNYFFLAG